MGIEEQLNGHGGECHDFPTLSFSKLKHNVANGAWQFRGPGTTDKTRPCPSVYGERQRMLSGIKVVETSEWPSSSCTVRML